MSRLEIHHHGQVVKVEALDSMVEALSVVMQPALTKFDGLIIDGLAADSADAPDDTMMSLWVSSAAIIKFIYRPNADPEATKKHVEVMNASLERSGRIYFSSKPKH